jgi:alginate O-acetyltransferase complex protein AlgJ
MMIFGRSARLPNWMAAIALLALPLATLWNLVIPPNRPLLAIKIGQPLIGVTQEPPFELSFAALFDRRLQKSIAMKVTEAVPIRPLLVRVNNQIEFSLFNQLNLPNFMIGTNGQLLESYYLTDYCERKEGDAELWSNRMIPTLLDMQAFYKSHNAIFVYVITPSKAAHLPEYFVDHVPCPSTQVARNNLIPDYAQKLRDAGIAVLDLATFIHNLKGRYPTELFPQGGIHWNSIGSSLAALEIIKFINKLANQQMVPAFQIDNVVLKPPEGTDRDLANLINVLLPPISYETPRVTYKPSASCTDHPARLIDAAVVGGSFMDAPTELLIGMGCLSRLNLYGYLRMGRLGGAPLRMLQPELTDADLMHLREVKLLVLEENEAGVGRFRYVDALHTILLDK